MTDKEKIEKSIQNCDDECEGANYHHDVWLAGAIWERIEKHIPKDIQVQVCQSICVAIQERI